jgi:hypothetical protein
MGATPPPGPPQGCSGLGGCEASVVRPWESWLQMQSTQMALQTKTVVAETFVHLSQCLAEIEIEITARALRLSSFPPPLPGKMTPLHPDHVLTRGPDGG